VHDLDAVENSFKIGNYKILFIFSCAISCLIYYSGVVVFPLSSARIREEFDYSREEYATMFFVGACGAFFGIGTTTLADYYGRANT